MTSDYIRRMFSDSVCANDNDSNPVVITIDRLNRMQDERHGWLSIAAAQIERWKQEDAEAGQPWGSGDAA